MLKNIETLYLNFLKIISTIFEAMTCRTKPHYQPCNYHDDEDIYFKPPS